MRKILSILCASSLSLAMDVSSLIPASAAPFMTGRVELGSGLEQIQYYRDGYGPVAIIGLMLAGGMVIAGIVIATMAIVVIMMAGGIHSPLLAPARSSEVRSPIRGRVAFTAAAAAPMFNGATTAIGRTAHTTTPTSLMTASGDNVIRRITDRPYLVRRHSSVNVVGIAARQ